MSVTKKLYRSCTDKILGGVAGGLGEYFDMDPTLIRLVFALAFLSGFGFLAYLLAWIIVPEDPSCKSGKTGADEIREHADRVAQDFRNAAKKETMESAAPSATSASDFRFWAGLVLVFFAASIILQNIFGFDLWHNFWPLILVALGVVLIAGSLEKK